MPTLGKQITPDWSGGSFYLVSNTAGVAVDANNDPDGIAVHCWAFDENNENQIWTLQCINDKAGVWTLYNERTKHYIEFRDGDSSDNTDVVGNPRKETNDIHRHDQEFYIYHVEGAGGYARVTVALQNVMGENFLSNAGNGSSDGNRLCGNHWDGSDACIFRIIQAI